MASTSEVKASNARISKDTAPQTAVFTGATDGIGKATLARLITTKLPIRVYVIGRNGEKHKAFLDELRKSNDQADIIWLEGQLTLLSETKKLCDIIKKRETSIDALLMSAGMIPPGERIETAEGNLMSLSLSFYSRTMMMTQLLPLLNASSNNPRIVSILAAGNESSSLYLDDLELKKPENFGMFAGARSSTTYTTLTMSRLAQENPRVVVIHHYPGGVNTGVFKRAFGDRWFWWFFPLVLNAVGTSPEDAGEKALYLLTSAKYGGKGVPLTAREHRELTMAKTEEAGSLFLIRDKLQGWQQEKIMEELKQMDAGNIVWKHVQEKMSQYTS